MRWMHLRLEAPLASFGGEAIDAFGVTRDFPSQSMLTGLLANALGWTRAMREEHQNLQERIFFGAVHDSDPAMRKLTDYQTAKLGSADKAWSTRGYPIGRSGGPATFKGSHQRWRDFHADLRLSVVLRLVLDDTAPLLDTLEAALSRPARPLFIGRKPCLPTAPIFHGWIEDRSLVNALCRVAPEGVECEALWPRSAGTEKADAVFSMTDERNWISGLHGGMRQVCRGRLRGRGTDQ